MSRYTDSQSHPITQSVLVDATGNLLEADDTDGQPVLFAKARNYVWDPNGLTWVRETQPGGGGGGGAVTVADGADVTQGAIADTAVVGDNTGTVSAKLRGINKALAGTLTISGTVTANQGGSPWGQNLTQVASTALGATAVTNFGTAPAAAAVPGVNASLFSGTTGLTNTGSALDVNLKTSSITLAVSGTVTTTPPANASTNVAQFGGNAVVTGVGASGVGIPRVTVSNDSNILATQSGTWNIGTLTSITNPVAATQSGTWTVQQGGAPWSVTFPSTQNVSIQNATLPTGPVTQSTNPWQVGGVVADNTAPTGLNAYPVLVAGQDNTGINRSVLTDAQGTILVLHRFEVFDEMLAELRKLTMGIAEISGINDLQDYEV